MLVMQAANRASLPAAWASIPNVPSGVPSAADSTRGISWLDMSGNSNLREFRTIPEPESMYPDATALKSTRPPGSGDLEQTSPGRIYSGSGLVGLGHDFESVDRYAANDSLGTLARTPVREFQSTNPAIAGLLEILVRRNLSKGLQEGAQPKLGNGLQTLTPRIGSFHILPPWTRCSIAGPRSAHRPSLKRYDQCAEWTSVCFGLFDLSRNDTKNIANDAVPRTT